MNKLSHLALAFSALACSLQAEDPAFRKDLAKWRQERNARLTREDGWLTLVGLHWLKPGENAFGSDPGLPVVLTGPGIPPKAGVLVVGEGTVRIRPLPDGSTTVRGVPITEEFQVKTDLDGNTDTFQVGALSFHVIKRNDRFAVRVKDPKHSARVAFKGVPTYRPKEEYRVVGTFVPFDVPHEIQVPTIVGYSEKALSPGLVTFRLHGRKLTLEPIIEDPKEPELFFIFRDATSGKGTYGAGRFLYAAMPKDGKVILDFNRAQNPPCAFTPFATCPLPPKQNWLPVPIPAGEKTVGDH